MPTSTPRYPTPRQNLTLKSLTQPQSPIFPEGLQGSPGRKESFLLHTPMAFDPRFYKPRPSWLPLISTGVLAHLPGECEFPKGRGHLLVAFMTPDTSSTLQHGASYMAGPSEHSLKRWELNSFLGTTCVRKAPAGGALGSATRLLGDLGKC